MTDSTPNPDTIQIPLTRGFFATVDKIDADLNEILWHLNGRYANHKPQKIGRPREKRVNLIMHRVILARMLGRDLLKTEYCDHINGNGLDNCRCNLRIATAVQNALNSKIPSTNTSGYKGVVKYKNRWRAIIKVNKKIKYLGIYADILDAARAYNEAALLYHGEFAWLNEIPK